jgi:hypothetical protein
MIKNGQSRDTRTSGNKAHNEVQKKNKMHNTENKNMDYIETRRMRKMTKPKQQCTNPGAREE